MYGDTRIQFSTKKDITDPYYYIKKTVFGYAITDESEYRESLKNQKKKNIRTTESETIDVVNKVN